VPIIKNTRHEKFAQELATGKSASEAYVLAGYKPSRKNASRLRTNEDIAARIAELQGSAARSTQITIQSICAELDAANEVARERGQAAAMVSASALRAKLAGLMVERVEVGGAGDFSRDDSLEDMANKMLADAGGPVELFRPVDQRDRERLIKLLERFQTDIGEFFNALRARPIVAERVDLANLRADWHTLRLHPSEIGKGNQHRLTNGR
jgi:terminase small subunit-like protein